MRRVKIMLPCADGESNEAIAKQHELKPTPALCNTECRLTSVKNVCDIVGLYLNPPDCSVMLCVN
jgi:hypothetical protein